MWTRKAALMMTSGISLVLVGMMMSNFQLMVIGIAFISFLAINSWVTGHGELDIVRTLSADNLYKGDDLYVELAITNSARRRTQLLEVFDNVPHEMKLRSGLNYMRINLGQARRRGSATCCAVRCGDTSRSGRYRCAIATPSTSIPPRCSSTTVRT